MGTQSCTLVLLARQQRQSAYLSCILLVPGCRGQRQHDALMQDSVSTRAVPRMPWH